MGCCVIKYSHVTWLTLTVELAVKAPLGTDRVAQNCVQRSFFLA